MRQWALYEKGAINHDNALSSPPDALELINMPEENLESLWPKFWPVDLLIDRFKEMGSTLAQCQYQNDTNSVTGGLVTPEMFKWVDALPNVPLYKILGSDLAISQKTTADYFALCEIYVDRANKNVYITFADRSRLTFNGQFSKIVSLHNLNQYVKVGVESNQYQEALAQQLRDIAAVPVHSVNRTNDKVMTAMTEAQPLIESGKVHFVGQSPIYHVLISELCRIHTSQGHDDVADAFINALMAARITVPRIFII